MRRVNLIILNKLPACLTRFLDPHTELQKRAERANQLVLFFLASANFWVKHRKTGEDTRKQAKTGAFLVLIFLGKKLAGANFYAFCNYAFVQTCTPAEFQAKNLPKKFTTAGHDKCLFFIYSFECLWFHFLIWNLKFALFFIYIWIELQIVSW